MLFHKRPFFSNWVLLAGLVLALSLPVIGQESILDEILPDAPLFSVVAPLSNDVVSGDVIFILKPSSLLSRADVYSKPLSFSASLSQENSYTASWSSLSVENGTHTFTFEACDDSRCETISVDVRVNNTPAPADTPPANETPEIISDVNADTTADPSSEISPSPPVISPSPSEPPPSRTRIAVSPSNYFGVFHLNEKDSSDSLRSSGDAFDIFPGTYSASARFPSPRLALYLNDVVLDSDNVLFHLDENVIQSFSVNADTYDVVSSTELVIPYSFYLSTLDFVGDARYVVFACLDWSYDSKSCRSSWEISSAPDFSKTFSTSSVVVGSAILRAAPSIDPAPDVNADVFIPAPPVIPLPPTFSITPSNLPSTFSIISSDNDSAPLPWGLPVELAAGAYSFDITFLSGDLQSASLTKTSIEHSSELLTITPFSSPFTFPHQEITLTSIHSILVHQNFVSESSTLTILNPLSDLLFACPSWDASSQSCASRWDSISSSGTGFSYSLPSSDVLIAFARAPDLNVPDVNIPDLNIPVPPSDPSGGEDARLINAIWALKNTHANKRFFFANDSYEKLSPLSTLFSSVDISLQCDPDLAPPFPRIPSSPVRDSDTAPPAPVSDTLDTTLSPTVTNSLSADVNDSLSISPFFDPSSILFFSNEWESALPSLESSRQVEGDISCDGVSLVNIFEDQSTPPDTEKITHLGDRLARVKHSMYVTNDTDDLQTRNVIVRFATTLPLLSTDAGSIRPSARYQIIPSFGETSLSIDANDPLFTPIETTLRHHSVLLFQNEWGSVVGSYDFSDLIQPVREPDVVVHARDGETFIETVISVDMLPHETIFLDPILDLAYDTNYAARWYGLASDFTGRTGQLLTFTDQIRTPGVQFFDMDGNGYANDLIITSSFADVNAKSNVGAVYMILDADTKRGMLDLNQTSFFTARWNGRTTNDAIGYSGGPDSAVQIVNMDGNAFANDLLISAYNADYVAADVGCVYLILDAHTKRGFLDLNFTTNFKAAWCGATATDNLSYTLSSGSGVKVVNVDGNAYANDLLLRAAQFDINSARVDVGAIFLIKDANTYSGINRMNTTSSYSVALFGQRTTDNLGTALATSDGLYLANLDGNSVANDLVIAASRADPSPQVNNQGAVYMFRDISTKVGVFDFNNPLNYHAKWYAAVTTDSLASTQYSGPGLFIVNADGNVAANDLVISCYLCNDAGTDRGAIYYINDINRRSGDFNLTTASSYTNRWVGAVNTDRIGNTTISGGAGTASDGIIINDYNGSGPNYMNDMLIVSALKNSATPAPARTDNGSVIYISDFNRILGSVTLNNTTSNYTSQWIGSRANDSLGDSNFSGNAIKVRNLDGNSSANDLIISSVRADTYFLDTGAVWLIMDFNIKTGNFDLNGPGKPTDNNYNARWSAIDSNQLTNTGNSGDGIQIVNVDNNAYANDLLLTSVLADVNGRTDAGMVYLIRDAIHKTGVQNLSDTSTYNQAWRGRGAQSRLGDTNRSGQGVFMADLDNNGYANDLLIAASRGDGNATNQGLLYIVMDVDNLPDQNFDLNLSDSFTQAFRGSTAMNELPSASDSNRAFNVIDADNNGYTNDLWIIAQLSDANSRLNAGSVYLIKDIASAFVVSANPPDINVWRFDGYPDNGPFPVFNSYVDGNLTLDFNVFDADTNSLLVDINYSSSSAPYTGTVIVDDVNLSTLPSSGAWFCNDTAFTNVTSCGIDWDISAVSDGNYFIHMTITDSDGLFDQNTSDRNVGIANVIVLPDYSFVLYLPSTGCTNGKGNITGGTSCQRAWFEATDTNGTSDQNQIEPEGQSTASGISFFSYDNTSSTSDDLNIILDLNADFPPTFILKASRNSTGYQGQCTGIITGCKKLSLISQPIATSTYSAGTQDLNIFFWGDFLGATAGRVDRNVNSTSGPTT